jgi:hypothetical protein
LEHPNSLDTSIAFAYNGSNGNRDIRNPSGSESLPSSFNAPSVYKCSNDFTIVVLEQPVEEFPSGVQHACPLKHTNTQLYDQLCLPAVKGNASSPLQPQKLLLLMRPTIPHNKITNKKHRIQSMHKNKKKGKNNLEGLSMKSNPRTSSIPSAFS